MILTSLLVGALVFGAVVAVFWEDIIKWLKTGWEKLPEPIKNDLRGIMATVKQVGNHVYSIIRYYSYNEQSNQWTETLVQKECNEADVPEHIRQRIKQGEVDITNELQEQLKLAMK